MNTKADVLIVTAAKVESRAVMQSFAQATGQKAKPERLGDRIYHNLGEVNNTRVFMALTEMGSGGLGASQQAVSKGIEALHPMAVIMVGIAFGINDQKQSIGDILISQQLWLYDLKRTGKDEIIPRGDKPHATPWLIDYLRSADLYWDEARAKVRVGLILTGDTLLDNIDYRDQLVKFESEAIGGEMEGAGLYVACHDARTDWIVVKAICDWADGNKAQDKDARQQKAAQNAAEFVAHALQHTVLKRSLRFAQQPFARTNVVADRFQESEHSTAEYLPIPLFPGIGNSYLKDNYLDPSWGDIALEGVKFRLEPNGLIFDTSKQLRYYLPRPDGGKEVELQLREPVSHVKSAHFLINSGNSKRIYASEKIGEIILLFKGAPPLVTELILGTNIREWCLGNPGDLVRETSSSASKVVWRGMSRDGANAVMDCLQIPVYESMRNCALEKIFFVHTPTQRPSDSLGVHYFVSAISLEIETSDM